MCFPHVVTVKESEFSTEGNLGSQLNPKPLYGLIAPSKFNIQIWVHKHPPGHPHHSLG
jgi:hypothetical protein